MSEGVEIDRSSVRSRPARLIAAWQPSIRWFAAEIVVVVAGILIALSAQDWWQARDRSRAEDALRQQFARDVLETRADLATDIEGSERKLQVLHRIFQSLGWTDDTVAASLDPADFGALLFFGGQLFPSSVAYQGLKEQGAGLIRSDSLRAAITTLYELTLPRVARFEARLMDFEDRELHPYLRPRLSIGAGPTQWSSTQWGTMPAALNATPRSVDDLKRDELLRLLMISGVQVHDTGSGCVPGHRHSAGAGAQTAAVAVGTLMVGTLIPGRACGCRTILET